MPRTPTSITTIMSGVRNMVASLTDFASVDTTVISATMTSVVDRMTSASNTYSTGPYTLMSTEP